jgi:hypothetical protein
LIKSIALVGIFLFAAAAIANNSEYKIKSGLIHFSHSCTNLKIKEYIFATFCVSKTGGWSADCGKVFFGGSRYPVDNGVAYIPSYNGKDIVFPDVRLTLSNTNSEIFCLGGKVLFQGYPNEKDSVLYKEPKDRYAVLTYCFDKLPSDMLNQSRVSHRSAHSFTEYSQALFKPISLDLICPK